MTPSIRGGRIEQVGTPMELYERPATPFVAGFIGSPRMNLFEGDLAREMGCEVYGIRPEHLEVSETDGRWTGRVRHVERLGADTILHLEVEALGPLLARVDGSRTFNPGQTVHATPNTDKEFKY
ncbi:ABC transporter ATP-binding protein [Histidinibacterium aquaticum]|uniref:ABC transporter ATP-binding protein n=1 Tax=Histidinibacterium aquaticum TaxID=2613962 RepID=A0A5J5GCC4_9RHOB|nr:ABC transporter ATP-binding protein [Histidinibacterium aquaticum]